MATMLTKDRTLISLSNMPGDWDTSSDPTGTREIELLRAAADKAKVNAGSNDLTYDDITVTRFWDEVRDAAIIRQWRANPSFYDGGTLSLTNLGTDKVPMGSADTYTYTVKSIAKTGSDANSRDKSKLTVVLAIAV